MSGKQYGQISILPQTLVLNLDSFQSMKFRMRKTLKTAFACSLWISIYFKTTTLDGIPTIPIYIYSVGAARTRAPAATNYDVHAPRRKMLGSPAP